MNLKKHLCYSKPENYRESGGFAAYPIHSNACEYSSKQHVGT